MGLFAQSIYVDNIMCGEDREHEAYLLYSSSREILNHGFLILQKFTTNALSLQVLVDSQEAVLRNPQGAKPHADVVEADETYVEATLPTSSTKHPKEHKVLGVHCNVSLDQLVLSLGAMLKATATLEPTKRVVVSLLGRIYNPLGFLSPVTVHFKILM